MFDLLSMTATQLPAIVGLICNFRQEQAAREDLTHRDFIEWLENHRHHEIKDIIFQTHNLQTEIDELLQKDIQLVIGQLQLISSVLSQLMSRMDGFSAFARALSPSDFNLTDQAEEILIDAAQSNFFEMSIHPVNGSHPVLCIDGRGWVGPEPRFILDDLESLLSLGLVQKSKEGGDGYPLLRLTRNGKKYADLLAKQRECNAITGDE